MTVGQYYKHFLGLIGAMTTAIGGLPLISEFVPGGVASYLFPPLGSNENAFRIAAIVLVLLTTLVVYFARDTGFIMSKRGRVLALLCILIVAIAGVTLYMVLCLGFVRSLPIPNAEPIVVSIGYERTKYAEKNFPNATDWELLRERGTTDEEIWRLWTERSVVIARVSLFMSYLFFLLAAVSFGSFAVIFDKIRPNS